LIGLAQLIFLFFMTRLLSLASLLVTGFPAVSLAGHSSLPVNETQEWQFRVFLDDKEIGTHDFRLRPDGGNLLLESEAAFDVKFLFFTAYSYRHRNVEMWDSSGLVSISAFTDANGSIHEVAGSRQPDAFRLISRQGNKALPNRLMTFAYWNPDILQQDRLLNSQTGTYEQVQVVDRGASQVIYQGQSIPARRYDILIDEIPISVWYAVENNLWLALESLTEGGRVLRYEPASLPQIASLVASNSNG
jgi:hypothetical protein